MRPDARIGVVLQGPAAQLASSARLFERAGTHTLWTGDYFQSGLVRAAVLGAATSRVRVGTHVVQAFARSPLATALAGHLLWTYGHVREHVAPAAGGIPITVARLVAADTVSGHHLDLVRRIAHYAVTPAYAGVLAAAGVVIDRDAVLAALRGHDDAVLDRELGPHLGHWCITSAQQLDEHRVAAAAAGVDELVLLVPFDTRAPGRVRTYESELLRLVTGLRRQ